jgi:hypothetical protein
VILGLRAGGLSLRNTSPAMMDQNELKKLVGYKVRAMRPATTSQIRPVAAAALKLAAGAHCARSVRHSDRFWYWLHRPLRGGAPGAGAGL